MLLTDNIHLMLVKLLTVMKVEFGADLASDMNGSWFSWNETVTIGYLGAGDEDTLRSYIHNAGGISLVQQCTESLMVIMLMMYLLMLLMDNYE